MAIALEQGTPYKELIEAHEDEIEKPSFLLSSAEAPARFAEKLGGSEEHVYLSK